MHTYTYHIPNICNIYYNLIFSFNNRFEEVRLGYFFQIIIDYYFESPIE